jgi:hypothetical protein
VLLLRAEVLSVKVKAPKSPRSVGMAIGCMVFIWELSESEPIEDVSKITFIISKSKGRAALGDKLSLWVEA